MTPPPTCAFLSSIDGWPGRGPDCSTGRSREHEGCVVLGRGACSACSCGSASSLPGRGGTDRTPISSPARVRAMDGYRARALRMTVSGAIRSGDSMAPRRRKGGRGIVSRRDRSPRTSSRRSSPRRPCSRRSRSGLPGQTRSSPSARWPPARPGTARSPSESPTATAPTPPVCRCRRWASSGRSTR